MDNRLIIEILDLCSAYILFVRRLNKRRRIRRWWSKPHIRYNYLTGYNNYERVFQYFNLNDEEELIKFIRMNIEEFSTLYELVRNRLVKRSRRPPLPSELRLALTLQ